MHCYLISTEDYNEYKLILRRATLSIKKAIKITEENDFEARALRFKESLLRGLLENVQVQLDLTLQKDMNKFMEIYRKAFMDTLDGLNTML